MAIESVAITAGSGTKIAVDVIDTDKAAQIIKLASGTDGSADLLPGDADNGLDVDVTRLPVDENGANVQAELFCYDETYDEYRPAHLKSNALVVAVATGSTVSVTGIETPGAAVTGYPVLTGGIAHATLPSAMDTGDAASLLTDLYGRLRVLPGANSGVDVGDVDVTSVAGMPTGANASQVQGTVAHDAAAAQNPVQVGGVAVSALPAAVANADLAHLITDLQSRLIILPFANPENVISGISAAVTDTTAANVIATDSGNGQKWYITDIEVTNSHATVGTFVDIRDSADLVIWGGYAAPAGGGWDHTFGVPLPTGANTHIHVKCATTGSSVYAAVAAFKAV